MDYKKTLLFLFFGCGLHATVSTNSDAFEFWKKVQLKKDQHRKETELHGIHHRYHKTAPCPRRIVRVMSILSFCYVASLELVSDCQVLSEVNGNAIVDRAALSL